MSCWQSESPRLRLCTVALFRAYGWSVVALETRHFSGMLERGSTCRNWMKQLHQGCWKARVEGLCWEEKKKSQHQGKSTLLTSTSVPCSQWPMGTLRSGCLQTHSNSPGVCVCGAERWRDTWPIWGKRGVYISSLRRSLLLLTRRGTATRFQSQSLQLAGLCNKAKHLLSPLKNTWGRFLQRIEFLYYVGMGMS